MAVRQYIGARYVPKFYEGSNGSEWDANVQYEPLTIVTYLNNTYTSKRFVPASVGSPMANPDYWVATGLYNAQLNALTERVNSIELTVGDENSGLVKDVDTLETTVGDENSGLVKDVDTLEATVGDNSTGLVKEVNDIRKEIEEDITVLVSDSYGTPLPTASWQDQYQTLMGLDNEHCIKLYSGGFCFLLDRFKSLITPNATGASISADVDPTRVTRIIVGGGFNDKVGPTADVEACIESFMEYANFRYPNAKVYIGFIAWSFNKHYLIDFASDKGLVAYKNCAKYGAIYLNGTEYIMHNRDLFAKEPQIASSEEDYNYVHPNDNGATAIAVGIIQAIKGGACSVEYDYVLEYMKNANPDMDSVTGNFIAEQLIGDKVYCALVTANYHADEANGKSFTIGYDNRILIARLDVDTGYLGVASSRLLPVLMRIAGGGVGNDPVVVPGFLEFQYNNVYARFLYGENTTCTYITIFDSQGFVPVVH